MLTNTSQAQSRTHARPKLQPSVIITRPNITIHDIAQSTTVTEADENLVFVLIKKIPYLAFTGELWSVYCVDFKTRPTLERRKPLGHLRSINRDMIIHFANQSQTCQLLEIFFFQTFHEKKLKSGAINLRLN